MTMFFQEPEPDRAIATVVAKGVKRIVANNPSKMTYHGTNSYIVGAGGGTVIIDPGPAEDVAHIDTLLKHVGPKAKGILVSHHHSDHFGAAPALRDRTGLPIYVSKAFPDDAFEPDGILEDGQTISGLSVLHTPGHASDHLCFARQDGLLFSGDHVMSWNSSIVSPPDGCMQAYCQQLQRLLEREDVVYLPGHGPILNDPKPYVQRLLDNRLRREAQIIEHLKALPDTAENIATAVYRKTDPLIAKAAVRNVLAHLQKLQAEKLVTVSGDIWEALNQ